MENSHVQEPIFAQIQLLRDNPSLDIQTLVSLVHKSQILEQKSLTSHLNINQPANDNTVCMYSDSLANILLLKYLMFFRDPQNDHFYNLVTTQLQKSSNFTIKRKVSHALKIYNQIIVKSLSNQFYQNRHNLENPLRKMINSNYSTLTVNTWAIMTLMEFLISTLGSVKLEKTVYNWIKEQQNKFDFNMQNLHSLQSYFFEQNYSVANQLPCIMHYGSISPQITVFLQCKEPSNQKSSILSSKLNPESFSLSKTLESSSSPHGYQLLVFVNRQGLTNFIQNFNEKTSSITEFDESTFCKIKNYANQAKIFQKVNSYKIGHFLGFIILLGVISISFVQHSFLNNKFFIVTLQLLSEISEILEYATYEMLQTLLLTLTNEWEINSLSFQE